MKFNFPKLNSPLVATNLKICSPLVNAILFMVLLAQFPQPFVFGYGLGDNVWYETFLLRCRPMKLIVGWQWGL